MPPLLTLQLFIRTEREEKRKGLRDGDRKTRETEKEANEDYFRERRGPFIYKYAIVCLVVVRRKRVT